MTLKRERALQTVAFIKPRFTSGHLIAPQRPPNAFGQAVLPACRIKSEGANHESGTDRSCFIAIIESINFQKSIADPPKNKELH